MYERFTDRARKVMRLAGEEARRLNHERIGTEHILLGLIAAETGVATTVLKNLGVELQKIRFGVENLAPPNPQIPEAETKREASRVKSILRSVVAIGGGPKRLAHTLPAKKVIEYAMGAARHFKHDYIGTEHLLLGLLREHDGVAAQTLRNLGVGFEAAEDEIMRVLTRGATLDPPGLISPTRKHDRRARPSVDLTVSEPAAAPATA
jgi:ATP-dependent Clp protease ATP-binding subunit ClpC